MQQQWQQFYKYIMDNYLTVAHAHSLHCTCLIKLQSI